MTNCPLLVCQKLLPLAERVIGQRLLCFVFTYHETGYLKWLKSNKGCLDVREVLMMAFVPDFIVISDIIP